MAKTGFFHHIGTFLLFAATILLLITSISSPVVNNIAILRVNLANTTANGHNSVIAFGTWGHCVLHAAGDNDYCTGSHVGYNPAQIIEEADDTDVSSASTNTSRALTRVMILHPIACVLAFIAFLLSAGSGVLGALSAALLAATAWIITVIVMATDFVLFGLIRRHVNDDASQSNAEYSSAMWTLVAAMVCLFFATIVVLFTCCSSRMHRQRHVSKHAETGYANGHTTTRRHFWQRRTRY